MNFARRVLLDELPRMALTYEGMASDAPWRAEAEARSEQIRKGDLTVEVADAGGRPLRDVEVRVEMVRHAFRFGSAVKLHAIANTIRFLLRGGAPLTGLGL